MWLVVALVYVLYVVAAVPLVAVVTCASYALRIPGLYLMALGRVLVTRPGWLPEWGRPPRGPAKADPAVPQYFYGPAAADVDLTVRLAYQDSKRHWSRGAKAVFELLDSDDRLLTGPLGVGRAAGMAAGTVLGAAAATGCALTYLAVAGLVAGLTRAAGTTLRGLDSAVLRIRHIRMFCPVCFKRVTYPGYVCPGPRHHPHRDVRPGRFGIVRRRCQCGEPMKTLLLFGSSRMSAFCPHCDHLLEHRPGEAPETVLPFFGAVGAGKTRLLFSIVTLLQAWDAAGELAAGFADSVTTRELAAAEETLRSGASTWATPPELPRAHLIRLRAGKDTRVLHMFDAAGERFYRASRTQELGFLGTAKTFVLVIDPLSVESFWTRLTAGRPGDAMPRVRSAPPSPDLAFNQAVQSIEAMRGSLKGARIAVVFSKADQYDAPPDVAEWAERELGLGNLVRAVQLQFEGHFIFMCAAAVMTGGAMHPSVARLLRWMLADEGISLPGSGP